MRITDVEFVGLKYPLAKPIPFSLGTMTHRQFALVRVYTDEGITGVGETSVNFPFWSLEERRATVEAGIKPLLVGENPLEIERLWEKMYRALIRLGLQWGARGPVYQAISGADLALWDILGKALGQPVYRLLGGSGAQPVPLYATGLDAEDLPGASRKAVEEGYSAIKLRVGFDVEKDVENVRAVREAVGPDVPVLVDANQSYERAEAVRFAEAVEPYLSGSFGGWFEEPIRLDDRCGHEVIRAGTDLRLAGGENAFGREDFLGLLEEGVFDVLMPDVTRAGGLTECRKICALCRQYGVPYSPHHYGSDVGFAASLHLFASAPGGEIMLRDVADVALREGVLASPLTIEAGHAPVPEAPGLGVELNEESVERYRVDR